MSNLALNLVASAARIPDRTAAITDEHAMTYAELDAASARLATLLEREGIGAGDRVGVMLPNIAAAPIAYYGIWRLGAIAVPMNPLMQGREVQFYLSNTDAKALIGSPGFAGAATDGAESAGAKLWLVDDAELARLTADLPAFGSPAERADSDTAVVLHTSGTTGTPKGAELTHGSLGSNQEVILRRLVKLTDEDVVLACLPLFHVFGMTCAMNAAIAAGAGLSLMARFDPAKAIERIRRDRVTVLEAVPTMYSALLSVADQFPPEATATLRTCVSGGAALPVAVLNDFEKAFDAMILEGYGLSETSPAVTFNHPDAERRPGSIGTPIEGVQVRLVDEDGNAGADRDAGGDSGQGPECDEGLLESARRHRRGDQGRLVLHGRHRRRRRRRVLLRRRPQERPDHSWRIQRLPARGGRGAARASRRCRGCGHRHSARVTGRGSRRGGCSEGRRIGRTGGTAAIRQGAGRRIQVPAPDLVRGQPAHRSDREAAAP